MLKKKNLKIGLLRIHEEYWPFLETLIRGLGHEPVFGKTNKAVIEKGTKHAENEQCVATKIAIGQAITLSKKVDYLLIPELISVYARRWTCPKWLGLYDMVKTILEAEGIMDRDHIIHPIADSNPDIGALRVIKRVTNPKLAANIGRVKRLWLTSLEIMGLELGKTLGISRKKTIEAILKAQHAQNNFWRKVQKEQQEEEKYHQEAHNKKVAVIAHPYLLSDTYLNHNMMDKIKSYGISVVTPDAVPEEIWMPRAEKYRKWIFWSTHARMLGSLLYWIEQGDLDAVMFISGAFCGEDALMELIYDKICKEAKILYSRITLDEHAGEAGFITRIEAFADTLDNQDGNFARKAQSIETILPKKIEIPSNIVASMPNMGHSSIAVNAVCNKLGIPFVPAPPTTERTTSVAIRYAPEFACRPFKVTLGNMLATHEKHPEVNLFFQGSGSGPCKYGLYHEAQQTVLESLGIDAIVWPIRPPSEAGIRTFLNCFALLDQFGRKKITIAEIAEMTKRSLTKKELTDDYLYKHRKSESLWQEVIRYGFLTMRAMDEVYKLGLQIRTFEAEPGAATKSLNEALALFWNIGPDIAEIPQLKEEAIRILHKTPAVEGIDISNPIEMKRATSKTIKVRLIGEFYEVLAHESNFDIARWFGERGIYVERGIHASDWLDPSRKCVVEGTPRREIARLAEPYLAFCGGDGQDTIGHIIHSYEKGFDGVVALRPLGCMPETVAAQIIPYLKRYGINIPVLIVTFDDQTAGSQLITRLEATLDQLVDQNQKESQQKVVVPV